MKTIIYTSLFSIGLFFMPNFILAQTDLCGNVTTNTTLALVGSPYSLSCDYIVDEGVTLTIEAGVEIDFPNYSRDIIINGTLNAQGTSAMPIRFYGSGQYNGGSLAFNKTSSGSIIAHARLDSLGTFSLSAYDVAMYIDSTTVDVSNTTFNNNIVDVRASASSVSGFNNTNSLNNIQILNNSLYTSASWPDADADGFYYQLLGDVIVPENTTLSIAPNVAVNFPYYDRDIIVNGTLDAQGTSAMPIRFYGSGPYNGGSLAFNKTSSGSIIAHARLDSLGTFGLSAYDVAMYIDSTTVNVSNTMFNNNIVDVRASASSVSGFNNTNDLNNIQLLSNSLYTSATWPDADADGFYYQLLGDVIVPENTTLSIAPNVAVNFPYYDRDIIVNGTLDAQGTSAMPIRFYGSGQYNGGSLAFNKTSSGSTIAHARLDSLGTFGLSAYDVAMYIDSTTVNVSNTMFNNNIVDVKASANGVSGFNNTNSLNNIQILNNSLYTSATWPDADADGFYYELLGDVTVPENATLTIEPNVAVNFPYHTRDIIVNGTLDAKGTRVMPIRFYGSGQYNGGSLAFNKTSSGSTITHARLDSLGTFSLSDYDVAMYIDSTTVNVSNTTFNNNIVDVKASANGVSGFNNTNSLNNIQILNNSLYTSATWPDADADGFYYELLGDVTVPENATLTIEPNVAVNFPYHTRDIIVNGTLDAQGNTTDSIRFYGSGQYNGGSIVFNNTSAGSVISHAVVEQLGTFSSSTYDAGIWIASTDVIIKNSSIRNNIRGIYLQEGSAPIIRYNLIRDNNYGIDVISSGTPLIEYNDILNNSNFGLRNSLANSTVNACNNWWGDPTGPYNATSNPAGLGDMISDNVLAGNCFLLCVPILTLTGNITDNPYQAHLFLISDGIVPNAGMVDFKAGQTISLLPGFTVEPQVDFSIEIGNCN